jgi:hypothetical protein
MTFTTQIINLRILDGQSSLIRVYVDLYYKIQVTENPSKSKIKPILPLETRPKTGKKLIQKYFLVR